MSPFSCSGPGCQTATRLLADAAWPVATLVLSLSLGRGFFQLWSASFTIKYVLRHDPVYTFHEVILNSYCLHSTVLLSVLFPYTFSFNILIKTLDGVVTHCLKT